MLADTQQRREASDKEVTMIRAAPREIRRERTTTH
jgi:hypothetical protein